MAKGIDKTLLKMKECGCRKSIIDEYKNYDEKENKTGTIQSFKKYRKELQGEFDEECKCIDCIDYLIYEIERNK